MADSTNGVSVNDPSPGDDATEDIVSVNSKGAAKNNAAGKLVFVVLCLAILGGLLAWASQSWLASQKESLKASAGRSKEETPDLVNPEKTEIIKRLKLGPDADPSPSASVPPLSTGTSTVAGIRPMRGPDGKIILNAQGRAMGVDQNGSVVEVPAITAMGGDQVGKKPLPAQGSSAGGLAPNDSQQPTRSRYGGALYVDGAAPAPTPIAPAAPVTPQSNADVLSSLLGGRAPGLPSQGGPGGPAFNPLLSGDSPGSTGATRTGSVGAQLVGGATPITRAKKTLDQSLSISKGRQADCVLTGRIIDEVPGFTSCTLTQNLYSDNGRILLLERGSDLIGEYGTSTQPGVRRLFVTWSRVKTPSGIEVDLSSPGADSLGTSGIPGQLDNKWSERIGAALLLSFIKDVAVAVIANQDKRGNSGTSVTIEQKQPGQATQQAGFSIADEVVRQTIKVRPTLTINEGDRISIYVARDLDFSSVYSLRSAGLAGSTRLQ